MRPVTGKQRSTGRDVALPELPSTSYAVLGLLSSDRELSGYDLRKWASNSLQFFYWSPSLSHIYTELRRLEGLGFVSQRIEPRGELRARRLYRITPPGLEALRTWVRTAPVESTVLKHSIALRVWLGHLIGLDSVRDLVAEHLAATETLIDDIRRAHDSAPADTTNAYAQAILEWAQEMQRAEIEAFTRLETKLKRARPALPARAS
jgi:DNA-binding PadR family transcriptional regulator